jgi:hypothetical protein
MEPELQAFVDAWANRETRDQAVALAEAYVLAHPELEHRFGHLSLEEMVGEVSHYRSAGRTADMVKAEMWLKAYFEPQHIGGTGKMVIERRKIGGQR